MSEEAVRQTRSQKRALEKEVTDLENSNKKPKLDFFDLTSRTPKENEHNEELLQDKKISKPLLPLALTSDRPSKSSAAKNEHRPSQKSFEEASTNNQTQCTNNPKKGNRETTDTRILLRLSEPNVTGGMLAVGEVEATIKVEVQETEKPVDMSTYKSIKREKWPSSSKDDDIIILSDNDSPSSPMNGLCQSAKLNTELLMKSTVEERGRIIKQLKQELRLEEAKLVLLKKFKQSQIQRDTPHKSSALTGSSAPPPLIRGSLAGSKVSQQQVHALRQQQQQQKSTANSISGPPPLLLCSRTSAPVSASQCQRSLIPSGLIRVGNNVSALGSSTMKNSTGSALSVISVNDSPVSRQAAAKLALRKQLEKTLLEIPPPKPPAPEFNFLPSAANNEFIYLVGLEEVVQNLLNTFHKGKMGYASTQPIIRDPFICMQCKTDFTCCWKEDKTKKGVVLCKDCMSSNQKKVLKAEHTKRLKAAFVKALQQEQEIEQCILQASSTVSHRGSSASFKTEHLVSQQLKQVQARVSSLQQHHQSSRGVNVVHHTIKQNSRGSVSVSVRGGPHSFSSSSQLQSAVAAAALVSQPGVTMAYVNSSLTGHKTSLSVDARQREYLLDMIPSRSSISQTANTWK